VQEKNNETAYGRRSAALYKSRRPTVKDITFGVQAAVYRGAVPTISCDGGVSI
jgi:hypothetical protein